MLEGNDTHVHDEQQRWNISGLGEQEYWFLGIFLGIFSRDECLAVSTPSNHVLSSCT
jgi:hypothetical protein